MNKPSKDNLTPVPSQTPGKSETGKESGDVPGEGNYTAARRFRAQEGEFVARNKDKIPQMGKAAAKALDGPEGADLRKAEDRARSHSHAPNEDR
ncbi:MAG TPA: hypothetical protein VII49_08195 [Rhizomicrobium sp.]